MSALATQAALAGYGVPADRIYVDEGFTGTTTGGDGDTPPDRG